MRALPLVAPLALLLAVPAAAQEIPAPAAAPGTAPGTAPYLIRAWADEVKLGGGATATWSFAVTYDPAEGLYALTARDASGAVVRRETSAYSLAAPSAEEVARARAIILSDPELGALHAAAAAEAAATGGEVHLEGGFELVREGGACGAGSRCLQFDLYTVEHAERRVERVRYVVVDLRTGAVVSRDLDPSVGGNETRFNRDLR